MMIQNITEQMIAEGNDNKITDVIVFTQQAYLKRQINTHTQLGLNRFFIEIAGTFLNSAY